MCLIITGQSNKIKTTLINNPELLWDIFCKNPDGIGAMYSSSGKLVLNKSLTNNPDEFIGKLPNDDRQLSIHFRWATHGKTNLANCHPYKINKGFALMHNGILHTGNAGDKTLSDTAHFINDYLRCILDNNPDILESPGFISMLENFIGDNRFVIMDKNGKTHHINHEQGIEYDGLWFSNLYAWDCDLLIPRAPSKYYNGLRGYKGIHSMGEREYMDENTEDAFDYITRSESMGYVY